MKTFPPMPRTREAARDGERGSALLLALMVALVMLVMGLGLATQSFLGLQASATDRWVAKSFYAAEAGLSVQISLLKAGSGATPGAFVLTDDSSLPGLMAGRYTVTVEDLCQTRVAEPAGLTDTNLPLSQRFFHIRARSNRTVNFVSGAIQSGVTGAAVEVDVSIYPIEGHRLADIDKCYMVN
jgi:Tfp pilus assembly protein PilX